MGKAPVMEKLYQLMSKVARSSNPVLISGEEGTGKEVVARAIHFHGPNAEHPFLPVDCRSMMPSLLERELFGYVKGPSPGAHQGRIGLLSGEMGRTVFMNDIDQLSPERRRGPCARCRIKTSCRSEHRTPYRSLPECWLRRVETSWRWWSKVTSAVISTPS
jgi:hypothetical protein